MLQKTSFHNSSEGVANSLFLHWIYTMPLQQQLPLLIICNTILFSYQNSLIAIIKIVAKDVIKPNNPTKEVVAPKNLLDDCGK